MKNNVTWDYLKKILGVVLIIGGIIGLFLPLLQGVFMIIAGAYLLNNKRILAYIKKLQAYFKKR